jgi:hypothetical protein
MFFWLLTTIRYLLAASASLMMSVVISFLILLPLAKDDSPGLGFLWFFAFIGLATLLIPLSLGCTAELIQRKVLARRFEWRKALTRSAASLPIAIGPVYAAIAIYPYSDSHRPAYWLVKEVFFFCFSGVFAYFALRIRMPHTTPAPSR